MTLDPTIAPSIDENARRRFEADWQPGRPDRIGQFLPPGSDPRYLATLEELVQIDLEFAWKQRGQSTGNGPRPPLIEDYLKSYRCLNDPAPLGRLLRQEYIVRHH